MAISIPQAQQVQMNGNETQHPFAAGAGAAAVGLVGDFVNYFANRQQNSYDRQFNHQQGAISRAFNKESQLEAERYNSITRQTSDAKQAGLNPALVYQSAPTSQVTANSSSPVSAPQRSEMKLDALGAARLYSENQRISAEVENLDSNTALNNSKKENQDIQNSNQNLRNMLENSKLMQEIDELLSKKDLNNEQRENLSQLRDSVKALNTANAAKANADADYTAGVGTRLAESSISVNNSVVPLNNSATSLNKAKTATESTVQSLNKAKTITEQTVQDLNIAKTLTESYEQALKQANTRLSNLNSDRVAFDLGLDSRQKDLVTHFVKENNLPAGSEKAIMLALDDFAKSTGVELPKQSLQTITSWLKADNILPFISDLIRTKSWQKPQNGSDAKPTETPEVPKTPPTSSQNSGSHNPSDASFINDREKYAQKHFSKEDLADVEEYAKTHNRLETAHYINSIYVRKYRHSNKR